MKKTLLLLFILVNINTTMASIGDCLDDPERVQDKIRYLKKQVYCSNTYSINECMSLIKLDDHEDLGSFSGSFDDNSCQLQASTPAPLSPLLKSQANNLKGISVKLSGREYVDDAVDFYHHMQMHKKRVVELGMNLVKEFPEEFKGVDEWSLRRVLSVHDDAKVTFNSRYQGRPFYDVLYEQGYGKKIDRTIVDALNKVDGEFVKKALDKSGLSLEKYKGKALEKIKKKREMILKIEKIADFVDRGMSPVSPEEFGRTVSKASESEFFLKNKKERAMAKALEDKYSQFTKGLSYKKLSPSAKIKLTAHLKVGSKYGSLLPSKSARVAISARAIASQFRHSSKRATSLFLKLLSKAKFANALTVFELLATPTSTSCAADIGYHDWVQNPSCKPLMAFGPEFISFLSEDWDTQVAALASGKYMCSVVDTIFNDLQDKRFHDYQCGKNGKIAVQGLAGKSFSFSVSNDDKVSRIEFKNKHRGRASNKIKSLNFDSKGEISQVCFENRFQHSGRNSTKKKCYVEEDFKRSYYTSFKKKQVERAKEYIRGVSFDLARVSECCNPELTDPDIIKFCNP